MMRFMLLLAAVLMLGGCSHHRQLALGKKERLVSELITSAPECATFKTQLIAPTTNDDQVDVIFHQALTAHCIKKDV
jgi:hypothetical protein